MVAPFVGKQIPGGCDYCDAYQTIEPIPGFEDTGAWINQIHHDDWCPWWIRHRNRAARRAAVKKAKQRRRVS
jgi:hypothetical protein